MLIAGVCSWLWLCVCSYVCVQTVWVLGCSNVCERVCRGAQGRTVSTENAQPRNQPNRETGLFKFIFWFDLNLYRGIWVSWFCGCGLWWCSIFCGICLSACGALSSILYLEMLFDLSKCMYRFSVRIHTCIQTQIYGFWLAS